MLLALFKIALLVTSPVSLVLSLLMRSFRHLKFNLARFRHTLRGVQNFQ